ncbi:MAG TPA: FecR domain-containing protein, partial [Bryobacteraceae bacterium]|nr:FecR domain-containing protein [Bryobacteraceae bacterium]
MKRAWPATAKILTGFFVTAMYAMPQAYTISAKPGVVNYVEGNAFLNGREISTRNQKTTFLNANDTISTDLGKAEVLLAPGVFLRIGDNTAVRMVSPSLTDTQVEVKKGEAMIEADDIVKDSHVTVVNGGGTAVIEKNGLYRFAGNEPRRIAVLEGKVQVSYGDRKSDVGKGHEIVLEDRLKTNKFDTKQQDDLYAWSNVRAEYNAASSFQAAKDVDLSSYGGAWGGYGFSGFANPGWM